MENKFRYLTAGVLMTVGTPEQEGLEVIGTSRAAVRKVCAIGGLITPPLGVKWQEPKLTIDYRLKYKCLTLDGNVIYIYENEDTREIKFTAKNRFIWRPHFHCGVDIYEVIE